MDKDSLTSTIQLIQNLLPDFEEFLSDIKLGHGFFNLSQPTIDMLSREGLSPWATFYEDPAKIKSLALHALVEPEEISEILNLSPDEQELYKEELKLEAINSELFDSSADDMEPATQEELEEQWNSMTDAEKIDSEKSYYLLVYSFITQMSYYLAIMSFGKSICDLVQEAKGGCDKAFCKAVQVDKTILTGIPYFRNRLLKAQLGSEPAFLHDLALAIEGPSLRSKLSYPKLMFVFAILDDEGFLDMPLDGLMDVCQEIGVYGREFGIEDTESLRKRRKYYREQTGRQIQI
ncbi:MAG: hypothetical protein JKY86_02185 [Gammaproteobacteria bacterium]|nr:hypothetical protein [Gammaproteobacteria bacterium]